MGPIEFLQRRVAPLIEHVGLEKTMAMSRSMGQVVEASAIPLIEDPDDAVVWGVALGLQDGSSFAPSYSLFASRAAAPSTCCIGW